QATVAHNKNVNVAILSMSPPSSSLSVQTTEAENT
ncbi:MAG: hypothetical protein ACI9MC_000830, partial [Kiritimatiellia bacterium]